MAASEEFSDFSLSATEFRGTVRLFPLPDLVLFPHVMQPLHIFEPRYRDLLEDALQDDQLIAMSLLEPGWEVDYDGRPPVCPMACLARLTSYRRLDDGTYNLLVLGLHRIRLVRELPPLHLYREAAAELCLDYEPPLEDCDYRRLANSLRESLLNVTSLMPEACEQLRQLVGNDLPLATLTDVASYVLDVESATKHQLLAETNVCRRAEMLIRQIEAAQQSHEAGGLFPGFPPRFSEN